MRPILVTALVWISSMRITAKKSETRWSRGCWENMNMAGAKDTMDLHVNNQSTNVIYQGVSSLMPWAKGLRVARYHNWWSNFCVIGNCCQHTTWPGHHLILAFAGGLKRDNKNSHKIKCQQVIPLVHFNHRQTTISESAMMQTVTESPAVAYAQWHFLLLFLPSARQWDCPLLPVIILYHYSL